MCIDPEFVVPSPKVLDEGVSFDDHAGGPVPFGAPHGAKSCLEAPVVSFDPVVGVLSGVVQCSRQEVGNGPDQCVGPVSGDLSRPAVGTDRIGEERRGGLEVSPLGYEHVDDLPVLVNGAVDVSPGPGDLHVGFIDKPVATHAVAARPSRVDEQWREPLDPKEQGHVVDLDATFGQQFFQIPIGQSGTSDLRGVSSSRR